MDTISSEIVPLIKSSDDHGAALIEVTLVLKTLLAGFWRSLPIPSTDENEISKENFSALSEHAWELTPTVRQ